MKKFIALFLAIVSITLIICSCSKNTKPVETETDENGDIITTTTARQTTKKSTNKETTSTTQKSAETTNKTDSTEFTEDHYIKTGYLLSSIFVETPSRIILGNGANGLINYYSKADGRLYVFCFDPLCDHNGDYCIALKFRALETPIYAPQANRLYMVRKENIFSMNFDGTDIKLEVSLGEHGKNLNSPIDNEGSNIINLQVYDNYLYFVFPTTVKKDSSTDFGYKISNSLFRYNLETKKLENLTEKSGYESEYFREYIVCSDKIYFTDMTKEEGYRFCSANLDFSDIKTVNTQERIDVSNYNSIFYEGKFYTTIAKVNDGLQVQAMYIACFDPVTGEIVQLTEQSKVMINDASNNGQGTLTLNAVVNDYIYYSINEPFLLGVAHTKSGDRYVCTTNHTIYRMNKDGSNNTVVFEGVTSNDPRATSYAIEDMYITGNKVIAKIWANKYESPKILPNGYESANWQHIKFVTFDIAPDGSFVNMHELVLDE